MLLQFGVPGLDDLIESPQRRQFIEYSTPESSAFKKIQAESIAILGPDGTGKSVLALHLASRYAADCNRLIAAERKWRESKGDRSEEELEPPKILYISSDLRTPAAEKIWEAFRLNTPDQRHIPFERNFEAILRSISSPPTTLELEELTPDDTGKSVEFFSKRSNHSGQVGFLDLASNTAGDDWNFVNTLLVRLQSVSSASIGGKASTGLSKKAGASSNQKRDLPHLVIVDSVEGFETFVGKYDSFGIEQTRRARVAQCIRNAGERVDLVFVVEEPKSSEHLPEEYVTDVVLRLRKRMSAETASLTIEVQKARSREHAKGEHPFEIRDSAGTSTGNWENADTPRARNSYIEVFYSIAHRNRQISLEYGVPEIRRDGEPATFGLPKLEDLLPLDHGLMPLEHGLRAGTSTALIGDPSTGKSVLGERFLAQGFKRVARAFICLYLLKTKFDAVHDHPEIKKALDFTFDKLSESIIPPDKQRAPQPYPVEVGSDWLDKLQIAAEIGEQETLKSLRSIFSDDSKLKNSIPSSAWDALKEWNKRTSASKLATIDLTESDDNKIKEALGLGYQKADKFAPRSRAKWTADFAEVKKEEEVAKKEEKESPVGLSQLFYHPNLRFPGVLLTTQDWRGKEIADKCLEHLKTEIEQDLRTLLEKLSDDQRKDIYIKLAKVIETQLIVRRFDMQALPAAAVYHVIHRNLSEANKLIFGIAYPPHQDRRNRKTSNIRMVIDDLRVIAKINPEIARDGAFLPFLAFHLQREGIVSLLIHSDNILPNRPSNDETSRTLLSILKTAILTWSVPFEGRTRVAISVVPHTDPKTNGIVRELVIEKGKPTVTRRFELYAGVEEGKPVPVSLAVYIFNETPAFEPYVEEEDRLFREVFTGVEGASAVNPGRVIFPIGFQRYQALRDFTHLSLDALDGHTMVFQVDEYWALKEPHILENLHDYLNDPLPSETKAHLLEDPFGLFEGEPKCDKGKRAARERADKKAEEERAATAQVAKSSGLKEEHKPKASKPASPDATEKNHEQGQGTLPYCRTDYFYNHGYEQRIPMTVRDSPSPETAEKPDSNKAKGEETAMQEYRVPFMWDFGFVLARSAPWKMAMEEKIFTHVSDGQENFLDAKDHIREIVPIAGEKEEQPKATTLKEQNALNTREHKAMNSVKHKTPTVGDVYKKLTGESLSTPSVEGAKKPKDQANPSQLSWRKFFGACKCVADIHFRQTGAPTVPFDIACPSSETMNALILEIWKSEMKIESELLGIELKMDLNAGSEKTFVLSEWLEMTGAEHKAKSQTSERTEPKTQADTSKDTKPTIQRRFQEFENKYTNTPKNETQWSERCELFRNHLPLGALCLYKTWLLLVEVLQFDEFLDEDNPFTFRSDRTASLHAVASRHWYKTACAFSNELYNSDGIHDSVVATRMPGHFTTRGDWFLGSPKSSRSKLLAQHAIDLMCSRRANLTRLQQGLGLPVRDILGDTQCDKLRTALRCKMPIQMDSGAVTSDKSKEEKTEYSTEIEYGRLCALGKKIENPEDGFDWLWRRHIDDYDRVGRPLQKWLVRLFRWTSDYRMRRSRDWRGGFPGYDELTAKRFGLVADYPSFMEFGSLCDLLCEELRAAARAKRPKQ